MKEYKNLHLWMIIPFVLMQSGFIESYWLTWTSEPWELHVHALSATAWFILIMIQPYLATHGKIEEHRTLGIIGFFIAGATMFSALSISPRDVRTADSGAFPPPLTSDFFYGIVSVEMLMVLAFGIAVVMSIIKRKQVEDHSIWLISTVFYILMPGLGRAMVYPVIWFYGPETWLALSISAILIIAALVIVGLKLKKLKHPAIVLGIIVNVPTFFIYQIGQMEGYVRFIQQFVKYD